MNTLSGPVSHDRRRDVSIYASIGAAARLERPNEYRSETIQTSFGLTFNLTQISNTISFRLCFDSDVDETFPLSLSLSISENPEIHAEVEGEITVVGIN